MHIDPKNDTPIFKQIVQQIRKGVDAGLYKPGEMLPSLRALAIDLTVNPNTVQRAYDELERQGIAVAKRGVGMFVASETLIIDDSTGQRIVTQFEKTISAGVKRGMSPERLRQAFEQALQDHSRRKVTKK